MGLNVAIYQQLFHAVPMGLMVIDGHGKIEAWNHWMEDKTGHKSEVVLNKKLQQLYPEKDFFRYEWAFKQVISYGSPQILSQALNHYLVPIPLSLGAYQDIKMMQQHVEILPLEINGKYKALIVIQDVTDKFYQRATLMSMAHKLETETFIDALTGIYNRRYLWDWLEKTISTAMREKFAIACCLFDIDHFKKVNDTYGHEVGDEVIVSFVDVVKKNLRNGDVFVRYGGEEFITLLPRINPSNIEKHPQRVLNMFSQKKHHGSLEKQITCSVGVSLWQPGKYPMTSKELIEKADTALYQAKRTGRNKVCVYQESE